jgi:hypothetical protein
VIQRRLKLLEARKPPSSASAGMRMGGGGGVLSRSKRIRAVADQLPA